MMQFTAALGARHHGARAGRRVAHRHPRIRLSALGPRIWLPSHGSAPARPAIFVQAARLAPRRSPRRCHRDRLRCLFGYLPRRFRVLKWVGIAIIVGLAPMFWRESRTR
jgi:hypothetical protein